ncbi:MAG TPA: long-chain fatty acid--CoA ligase, partial [Anaerolineae bacterium]|nr:long-chain fatty acid--CoA ligase [Anaerolineae bacterium]
MGETFPQLLLERAAEYGDSKIALREKEFGIWQAVTWQKYLDHVKYFCLGLVSLGLERGDTIAIIGDNRPEWMYAELAAQSAGARSIGIYQDAIVSEMIYIVTLADIKYIVAEDQEQVDKILEMWDQLPSVKKVIYYDPKGLRNYAEDFLIAFPEVEELGRQYEKESPNRFE